MTAPAFVPSGEGARRLAAPFRVLVLLNDRLTLRLGALYEALREDFPGMDWPGSGPMDASTFDTAVASSITIDCGAGAATGALRAMRPPMLDWADLMRRNRIPEGSAEATLLARATTCIEVSVPSRGPALADRLEAARRATAVAAVFADLPIGVGAIELWSDRVLSPAQARDVSESAAEDDVPLLDWTLPLLFHHGDAEDGLVSGTTVGLSAFFGYELETRRNPEPAGLAIASLLTVAQDLVAGGTAVADGTEVRPFDAKGPAHLLRHVPQGRLGNDTDRWCLVHPDSPLDHAALLGRPQSAAPRGHGAARALARLRGGLGARWPWPTGTADRA